jgi:D-psicose/D-tagatose/L-ribulose 3-epimerase
MTGGNNAMQIGINMMLWGAPITEEHFPVFDELKAAGFDGVEIPCLEGEPEDYKKIGQAVRDAGLECTASGAIPDELHNPISSNPAHRSAATDYLKKVMDCCYALQAPLVCGPFYQPLGVFSGSGPTPAEVEYAAEVHRAAGEYGRKAGVVLAIEFLNRFECYFLNRMSDLARYIRKVDHPFVGAMFDTFHANIEERDPVGALRENTDVIRHIHISENDRGTPGRGHIDWDGTFHAIRESGYDGWLTIEAFGRSLPALAAATCVWRDLHGSPREVYEEGIALIKGHLES